MAKKLIPEFRSETEEQAFWNEHVATDYVDRSQGSRVVLPNPKLSTKAISLRLPEHLIEELKVLAKKQDVPYQSLLKIYLAERLDRSWHRHAATPRNLMPTA